MAVLAVAGVLAGAAAAAWWWLQRSPPVSPPVVAQVPAPAPPASLPASAAAPVPEPLAASQPVAAGGIEGSLAELLGSRAVTAIVRLDDFPRRLVATVDNLARAQAAARLWPVQPAAGRFTTIERDGQTVIDPANAARYEPFVTLVESIDPVRAVDLYVRLLPVLQPAYEEIGYPGRRFHGRVVEVIDHLLAAPEPAQPLAVRRVDVKGPLQPARPWLQFEFTDPSLQDASAGHKILARMGVAHTRRLKATLAAWRRELASRAAGATSR